jgi:para-nitrobenzyl esterase
LSAKADSDNREAIALQAVDPNWVALARRRSFLSRGTASLASLVLCGGYGGIHAAEEGPIVATGHGKVRGRGEGDIQIFRGIPYGGRVDGVARFKPPAPADSWSAIRDCNAAGPRAMQVDVWPAEPEALDAYCAGGRRGELEDERQGENENCLALNVLTPGVGSGRRPVMVYIHGGGFLTGSGAIALRARRLVREQDIVLVSVNHRLNVFGYLYLGALDERYADSGNAGMLDLVLALQWVRDNIAQFGGDPGNVTLFGESGGGWKVSILLAMPAARGLFHRAIVESGSAIFTKSVDEATQRTEALLGSLDIGTRKLDKLLEVPPQLLLKVARKAGVLDWAGLWPVIDGRNLLRQPFNPDAPPAAKGVPMIVGTCADEDSTDALQYHVSPTQVIPQLARALDGLPAEKAAEIMALYRHNYPGDTPAHLFFRITGDRDFGVKAARQAKLKRDQGDAVYRYLFTYRPPVEGRKFGAFHAAELPLVMRLVLYAESERLSRQMAGAWAAFARSGDPSQPGLQWPLYSLSRAETMIFDTESRVVDDPHRQLRLMWEGLPLPALPNE